MRKKNTTPREDPHKGKVILFYPGTAFPDYMSNSLFDSFALAAFPEGTRVIKDGVEWVIE